MNTLHKIAKPVYSPPSTINPMKLKRALSATLPLRVTGAAMAGSILPHPAGRAPDRSGTSIPSLSSHLIIRHHGIHRDRPGICLLERGTFRSDDQFLDPDQSGGRLFAFGATWQGCSEAGRTEIRNRGCWHTDPFFRPPSHNKPTQIFGTPLGRRPDPAGGGVVKFFIYFDPPANNEATGSINWFGQ